LEYTPESFWKWFSDNQHRYQQIEQLDGDDAHELVNEVVEELKKYDPWFKALMGKYDDTTSELIVTADGDIALFVKVEELIDKAPAIAGWKFTAHKPPLGFDEISIEMFGKTFDDETMRFYPITDDAYPDMVSVIFTHSAYNSNEADDFETGGSIYVQNAMGELNTAIQLDHYEIGPEPDDKSLLIPVTKLNDYLNWREKEFIEKYDHAGIEFPEDTYATIEGEDQDGNVMLAIVVSSLEEWPYRPVFCWWVGVQMEYKEAENGLPDQETLTALQDIEEKLTDLLTAQQYVVYVATKTFKGCRTAHFYAKNYKTPSSLLHPFLKTLDAPGIQLGFFIEKDKYWQHVEEFFGLDESLREEEDEEE
jgi:hypothetical protein